MTKCTTVCSKQKAHTIHYTNFYFHEPLVYHNSWLTMNNSWYWPRLCTLAHLCLPVNDIISTPLGWQSGTVVWEVITKWLRATATHAFWRTRAGSWVLRKLQWQIMAKGTWATVREAVRGCFKNSAVPIATLQGLPTATTGETQLSALPPPACPAPHTMPLHCLLRGPRWQVHLVCWVSVLLWQHSSQICTALAPYLPSYPKLWALQHR